LAEELGRLVPTAAYHAGLDAEHRKRVQEEFLADKIEVTVATIAFGMGIDKPDIRTVIHTALPGSLEVAMSAAASLLGKNPISPMESRSGRRSTR
jgi:superfamily II DNA helicase RecQ